MSGGTLRASGGFPGGGAGGGSGGAIRIVAPTFQGNGQIDTTGGILNVNYYGGTGRIRVDVLDRNGWNFTFYGKFSAGSKMVVFPPTIPRLDILEAAGQSIPFGTNSFVSIDLPRTAPTNQTVRVRATDFTGVVPISVVVVPDSGPSRSFPASIDMSGGNPSETNITVILTPGALNRIYSWTR